MNYIAAKSLLVPVAKPQPPAQPKKLKLYKPTTTKLKLTSKALEKPKETQAVIKRGQAPVKPVYSTAQLYNALQARESGGEKNKFIRTRLRKTPGGSSAYGPVQITGTLAKDYLKRYPKLFNPKEQKYLQDFIAQSKLFLHHGNMKGKLADYNPIYDYGGVGHLNTSASRRLYPQVANKIIGHAYGQGKQDLSKFIRRWRGKSRKETPKYYADIERNLNYYGVPQNMIKRNAADDTIRMQFIGKKGNIKGEVSAEIADNLSKRRIGLSGRAFLPEGRGMFFDKIAAFWMKDVNFPLDLIFLDKVGAILEQQHMPINEPNTPQTLYMSKSAGAVHAIELPAGQYEKYNLYVGDIVKVAKNIFYSL